MTGQAKTGLVLGAYLLLCGLGLLGLAVWSHTEGASISSTLTALWNDQPYVVLIGSNLFTAAFWYLMGHWFAGPRPKALPAPLLPASPPPLRPPVGR